MVLHDVDAQEAPRMLAVNQRAVRNRSPEPSKARSPPHKEGFAGNLYKFDACSTGYPESYGSLANLQAMAKKRYTRHVWIAGMDSDQP